MPTTLSIANECFLFCCFSFHLVSHASVQNSEKAVAVYEEMLSRGIKPDQKTLSHMIVAHSRGCHDAMYR